MVYLKAAWMNSLPQYPQCSTNKSFVWARVILTHFHKFGEQLSVTAFAWSTYMYMYMYHMKVDDYYMISNLFFINTFWAIWDWIQASFFFWLTLYYLEHTKIRFVSAVGQLNYSVQSVISSSEDLSLELNTGQSHNPFLFKWNTWP